MKPRCWLEVSWGPGCIYQSFHPTLSRASCPRALIPCWRVPVDWEKLPSGQMKAVILGHCWTFDSGYYVIDTCPCSRMLGGRGMAKLGEAAQGPQSPEGGQESHLKGSSFPGLTQSTFTNVSDSLLFWVHLPEKSACCGRTHFVRCLRFDWSHILWGKCYVTIMNRRQSKFHFKKQLFGSHKRNAELMNVIIWRYPWVASWNFIVKFHIFLSSCQKFCQHCQLLRSYISFPSQWTLKI